MKYQNLALQLYANADENKRNKAIAAGKQLDNSLVKEYGPEGATDCHFRVEQYLKYFSYEATKDYEV